MEIVYENPWFQVRVSKQYHIIDQPHSESAVVIIPRLPNGNFLLIRTWRIAVKKRLTEFPRGCAAEGESGAQCASRELAEETGYVMPVDKVVHLGTLHPDSGILSAEINVYYADLSYAELTTNQAEEEILGSMEADEETLRDMVDKNLITDSFTLCALAKFWNRKHLGKIK